MNYKWVFLFFLLGLPVAIYFFLQGFGENRFDVPVYYEDGIEQPISDCSRSDNQFTVPDYSEYDTTFVERLNGITVFDIGTPACDSCQFKINNLIALTDKFRNWNKLKIISVINEDQKGYYPLSNNNWFIQSSSNDVLKRYANCGLNLELEHLNNNEIQKNGVVVLIDDQRRIRGYYNIFDLKESDRLATELEIIRKNMN